MSVEVIIYVTNIIVSLLIILYIQIHSNTNKYILHAFRIIKIMLCCVMLSLFYQQIAIYQMNSFRDLITIIQLFFIDIILQLLPFSTEKYKIVNIIMIIYYTGLFCVEIYSSY